MGRQRDGSRSSGLGSYACSKAQAMMCSTNMHTAACQSAEPNAALIVFCQADALFYRHAWYPCARQIPSYRSASMYMRKDMFVQILTKRPQAKCTVQAKAYSNGNLYTAHIAHCECCYFLDSSKSHQSQHMLPLHGLVHSSATPNT